MQNILWIPKREISAVTVPVQYKKIRDRGFDLARVSFMTQFVSFATV